MCSLKSDAFSIQRPADSGPEARERAATLVGRMRSVAVGNVEAERLLSPYVVGAGALVYSDSFVERLLHLSTDQVAEIGRRLDAIPDRKRREDWVSASRLAKARRDAANARMDAGGFGWSREEEDTAHIENSCRDSTTEWRAEQNKIYGGLERLAVDPEILHAIIERATGEFDVDSVPMSDDPDIYCDDYDWAVRVAVNGALKAAGYDPHAPAIAAYTTDIVREMCECPGNPMESSPWLGTLHRQREQEIAAGHRRPAAISRRTHRPCIGRARARRSRGRAARRRGSRRIASRCAGGGSDDPEPEPGRASRPSRLGATHTSATIPTGSTPRDRTVEGAMSSGRFLAGGGAR